jgi:hypothetical protein
VIESGFSFARFLDRRDRHGVLRSQSRWCKARGRVPGARPPTRVMAGTEKAYCKPPSARFAFVPILWKNGSLDPSTHRLDPSPPESGNAMSVSTAQDEAADATARPRRARSGAGGKERAARHVTSRQAMSARGAAGQRPATERTRAQAGTMDCAFGPGSRTGRAGAPARAVVACARALTTARKAAFRQPRDLADCAAR